MYIIGLDTLKKHRDYIKGIKGYLRIYSLGFREYTPQKLAWKDKTYPTETAAHFEEGPFAFGVFHVSLGGG